MYILIPAAQNYIKPFNSSINLDLTSATVTVSDVSNNLYSFQMLRY